MCIRSKIFRVAVAVLGLLVSSCGSSKPSESEGRSLLEQEYKNNTDLKMVAFGKTNGQSVGEQGYIMSFSATFQVISTRGYCRGSFEYGVCYDGTEVPVIPNGGTLTRRGTIEFTKTENGWVGRVSER
jgi:hypothetical protein